MLSALVAGCAASTRGSLGEPVPGPNIHCIAMSTDAGFRARIQVSSASASDGTPERYEFDLAKLMHDLQARTPQLRTLSRLSSQPKLTLDYRADRIDIGYRVSQYQEGGMEMRNGLQVLTKPAVVTHYPLLTVPLVPLVPVSRPAQPAAQPTALPAS